MIPSQDRQVFCSISGDELLRAIRSDSRWCAEADRHGWPLPGVTYALTHAMRRLCPYLFDGHGVMLAAPPSNVVELNAYRAQ